MGLSIESDEARPHEAGMQKSHENFAAARQLVGHTRHSQARHSRSRREGRVTPIRECTAIRASTFAAPCAIRIVTTPPRNGRACSESECVLSNQDHPASCASTWPRTPRQTTTQSRPATGAVPPAAARPVAVADALLQLVRRVPRPRLLRLLGLHKQLARRLPAQVLLDFDPSIQAAYTGMRRPPTGLPRPRARRWMWVHPLRV